LTVGRAQALAPRGGRTCCGRCTEPARGLDAVAARRHLLKAAVFRPHEDLAFRNEQVVLSPADFGAWPSAPHDPAAAAEGRPPNALPKTASGTIVDISPQVLVLADSGTERRLALTADATAWRGTQLDPSALFPGDRVVVRLKSGARGVADRIWANIGRVSGIIMERSGSRLVVSEGATRKHQVVVIQPRVAGRIQVRFPTLEPGYLVDIIGLRRENELDGMIPATSQPTYRQTSLRPHRRPAGLPVTPSAGQRRGTSPTTSRRGCSACAIRR
jgi:hypothetical protein